MAIRAFVAIELGEELRAALVALIERLRPQVRGARWVAPAGIHLTLRFLGWTEVEVLQRLGPGLREAAAACDACQARVGGLGMFPERGAPRVLWVGLQLPEPIRALQQACEAMALAAGFEAEERAFKPHLTLARFRDRLPRPTLPPFEFGPAPLSRLVLYRSELKPGGAVYTPLEVFPLRGAAA
ncbi:MAG TPA: RNA 2',3'-cyclic phosphodiesterase [Vicinamibacteria bacterium]